MRPTKSCLAKIALPSAIGLMMLLSGCAQLKLGEPVASMENVQRIRSGMTVPVSVGEFAPAKELSSGANESFSVRSNTVTAPTDGSFSKYLRATLVAELEAAGLLQPSSPVTIRGELTRSRLEAPIGTGIGELAARFQVLRQSKMVYDRELSVSNQWPSIFVGAVAIPAAVNEYTALHRKLVAKLLEDKDFLAALKQE